MNHVKINVCLEWHNTSNVNKPPKFVRENSRLNLWSLKFKVGPIWSSKLKKLQPYPWRSDFNVGLPLIKVTLPWQKWLMWLKFVYNDVFSWITILKVTQLSPICTPIFHPIFLHKKMSIVCLINIISLWKSFGLSYTIATYRYASHSNKSKAGVATNVSTDYC